MADICTFLVAYESHAKAGFASRLENAITRIGGRWARPLQGLWYVESSDDVETLKARLAPLIAEDEGLIVQEVAGQAGVHNTLMRWTAPYARPPAKDTFCRSRAELSVVSPPL